MRYTCVGLLYSNRMSTVSTDWESSPADELLFLRVINKHVIEINGESGGNTAIVTKVSLAIV